MPGDSIGYEEEHNQHPAPQLVVSRSASTPVISTPTAPPAPGVRPQASCCLGHFTSALPRRTSGRQQEGGCSETLIKAEEEVRCTVEKTLQELQDGGQKNGPGGTACRLCSAEDRPRPDQTKTMPILFSLVVDKLCLIFDAGSLLQTQTHLIFVILKTSVLCEHVQEQREKEREKEREREREEVEEELSPAAGGFLSRTRGALSVSLCTIIINGSELGDTCERLGMHLVSTPCLIESDRRLQPPGASALSPSLSL